MRRLLGILLLALMLHAQTDLPSFDEGVELYNRGGYWEALRIFSALSDLGPENNEQLTASEYMRIRCYHKLGFNQRALTLAQSFYLIHPASTYIDDLDFLLGEIYLNISEPREAAWYFARAASYTDDRKVRRSAREFTRSVVLNDCEDDDLRALSTRSIDRAGQFLVLLVAERYAQDKRQEQAANILFNIRPFLRDSDLVRSAMQLYSGFTSSRQDTLHLALVLPLSGPLAAIGDQVLDGMRYAGMQFVDTTGIDLAFHVYDNAGQLGETISIAREIKNDSRIHAILGPLTNENVKGAGAVLVGSDIPLITPTATEDHLAGISHEIFQFRATRERKATALAEYAVDVLGLQSYAIIAPSTEYGQQMADNFASRVDELGGEIIYQGWYVGEPTDLSNHYHRVRDIGIVELFELMEADSIPDTTYYEELDSMVVDTVSEYTRILDPLIDNDRPTYSDSLRIKLSHIDAFFFPIHQGSIPYIASQFAHNNLDAHVLGAENWLDEEILRKNYTYLPLLSVVTGDRFILNKTTSDDFHRDYSLLYRRHPGQYDYLGYDSMSFLLFNALKAGPHYYGLRDILIRSAIFEGYVNEVQWGGRTGRENDRVLLLNYEDRQFVLGGHKDETGFFGTDSSQVNLEE